MKASLPLLIGFLTLSASERVSSNDSAKSLDENANPFCKGSPYFQRDTSNFFSPFEKEKITDPTQDDFVAGEEVGTIFDVNTPVTSSHFFKEDEAMEEDLDPNRKPSLSVVIEESETYDDAIELTSGIFSFMEKLKETLTKNLDTIFTAYLESDSQPEINPQNFLRAFCNQTLGKWLRQDDLMLENKSLLTQMDDNNGNGVRSQYYSYSYALSELYKCRRLLTMIVELDTEKKLKAKKKIKAPKLKITPAKLIKHLNARVHRLEQEVESIKADEHSFTELDDDLLQQLVMDEIEQIAARLSGEEEQQCETHSNSSRSSHSSQHSDTQTYLVGINDKIEEVKIILYNKSRMDSLQKINEHIESDLNYYQETLNKAKDFLTLLINTPNSPDNASLDTPASAVSCASLNRSRILKNQRQRIMSMQPNTAREKLLGHSRSSDLLKFIKHSSTEEVPTTERAKEQYSPIKLSKRLQTFNREIAQVELNIRFSLYEPFSYIAESLDKTQQIITCRLALERFHDSLDLRKLRENMPTIKPDDCDSFKAGTKHLFTQCTQAHIRIRVILAHLYSLKAYLYHADIDDRNHEEIHRKLDGLIDEITDLFLSSSQNRTLLIPLLEEEVEGDEEMINDEEIVKEILYNLIERLERRVSLSVRNPSISSSTASSKSICSEIDSEAITADLIAQQIEDRMIEFEAHRCIANVVEEAESCETDSAKKNLCTEKTSMCLAARVQQQKNVQILLEQKIIKRSIADNESTIDGHFAVGALMLKVIEKDAKDLTECMNLNDPSRRKSVYYALRAENRVQRSMTQGSTQYEEELELSEQLKNPYLLFLSTIIQRLHTSTLIDERSPAIELSDSEIGNDIERYYLKTREKVEEIKRHPSSQKNFSPTAEDVYALIALNDSTLTHIKNILGPYERYRNFGKNSAANKLLNASKGISKMIEDSSTSRNKLKLATLSLKDEEETPVTSYGYSSTSDEHEN